VSNVTEGLTEEDLATFEEIDAARSPGAWINARGDFATREKAAEAVARMVAHECPVLHALFLGTELDAVPRPESLRSPAVTGNGPTSEANARFIAMCSVAVPRLIAEARQTRDARFNLLVALSCAVGTLRGVRDVIAEGRVPDVAQIGRALDTIEQLVVQ
jgi:hypothetical protein